MESSRMMITQASKAFRVMGLACILCLTTSSPLLASDKDLFPDFYIQTQYAFTTAKSKLVVSNDLGSTLGYGLGSFAGNNANLGFKIWFSTDTISFGLNSSALTIGWQDNVVLYRMGPFFIGPIFSKAEITANKEGTDIIDAVGSGIGAETGVKFAVGKSSALHFIVSAVNINAMKDTSNKSVSIGQRLDIDLGARVDVTRDLVDFVFGYKTRSMSISYDSASYSEAMYFTYAGFDFSLSL
jgi:hypothetical protein